MGGHWRRCFGQGGVPQICPCRASQWPVPQVAEPPEKMRRYFSGSTFKMWAYSNNIPWCFSKCFIALPVCHAVGSTTHRESSFSFFPVLRCSSCVLTHHHHHTFLIHWTLLMFGICQDSLFVFLFAIWRVKKFIYLLWLWASQVYICYPCCILQGKDFCAQWQAFLCHCLAVEEYP